jgi:Ras association domain-containing protein 2/4
MWKCHKCGKPVYFAERKQSLGYNWHPECLRCEECGKRLNPGQHAEHKGVPYCHVPCYGALFGPQLFGHGTRVESHKSFGLQKDTLKVGNGPSLLRSQLDSKLKVTTPKSRYRSDNSLPGLQSILRREKRRGPQSRS